MEDHADHRLPRRRMGEKGEEPEVGGFSDVDLFRRMVFDNIKDYQEGVRKGETGKKNYFDPIGEKDEEIVGFLVGLDEEDMKIYNGIFYTGDLSEEKFIEYKKGILEKGNRSKRLFLLWLADMWPTELDWRKEKEEREEKERRGSTQ